ncbi:unnamed protein product [Prorocentrum cordatum]|uniref:Uncharacterized protein n=1 Tax=Prorocentrum cordatum TaxID=2364126 RepID=A0ABN9TZV3_9DINO|nr:unnamed protein product [Polarella glacialis]
MARAAAPMLLAALCALAGSVAYVAPPGATRPAPRTAPAATAPAPAGGRTVPAADAAAEAPGAGAALRAALAACAALMVVLAPLQGAEAARSGGRMGGGGGSMGRSSGPARGAPARGPTARAATSSTTNVVIGGGYSPFGFGYGMPMFFPSPFGFGGFGGGYDRGPTATDQQLSSQQAQDERKMDAQSAEIAQLQREIADMKAKR